VLGLVDGDLCGCGHPRYRHAADGPCAEPRCECRAFERPLDGDGLGFFRVCLIGVLVGVALRSLLDLWGVTGTWRIVIVAVVTVGVGLVVAFSGGGKRDP
jgi:hypothetical protein